MPTAAQNGYRAIVVTCDDPTNRVRDYILPVFLEASKFNDQKLLENITIPNMNVLDLNIELNFYDSSITWENIKRLRKMTTLPIICKEILSPLDAELAIKYGTNEIIVRFYIFLIFWFNNSNHDGRQIDTTVPATAIECLEDILLKLLMDVLKIYFLYKYNN